MPTFAQSCLIMLAALVLPFLAVLGGFLAFGIFLVIQDLWGVYVDPLIFNRALVKVNELADDISTQTNKNVG